MKNEKNDGIIKNSIVVSSVVFAGKILGFVKQSVIAWAFGVGNEMDCLLAADGYITMIIQMLAGSVPSVVLTQYIHVRERDGQDKGEKLIAESVVFFSILGLVLSVLSIFFSNQISEFIGISYTFEQKTELRKFLIFFSPTIFFTALTAVCCAYMDAHKIFAAGKLSGIFTSVAVIICVVNLRSTLKIWSFALGAFLGSVCYLFLMLGLLCRYMGIKLANPLRDSSFSKVIKHFILVIIGNSTVDIVHWIDKVIASSLKMGSISVLHYAQIASSDVVNAVLITSFGTVFLPSVTEKIANHVPEDIICDELHRIINAMICLMGLIIALYFVEGLDLIKIFFERGAFTTDISKRVYRMALAYSIGFIFISFREVLIKLHFAFGDTASPMINSIIGSVVNLFLSVFFSQIIGETGIALATSLSMLVVAVLSFITIKKHISIFLFNRECVINIGKIFVSGFISIFIGSVAAKLFYSFHLFPRMILISMIMTGIYIFCNYIAKEKTVEYVKNFILKR